MPQKFTPFGLKDDYEKQSLEKKKKLEAILLKFRPWENKTFISNENGDIAEKLCDYDYQSNELLDLHTSGLSPAKVEFIYVNSDKHDFAINVIGLFANK